MFAKKPTVIQRKDNLQAVHRLHQRGLDEA